ncbi:MAG: PKD domain-containing protein [Calditrichaeota bacterium]|nr:PKD domain-containing protein [Calditrichota bacterium]
METTTSYPAVVDRYRVLELLSEYPFSTVHRVREDEKHTFLMRILRREFVPFPNESHNGYYQQVQQHFLQSGKNLQKVKHPNVVECYQQGLSWNKYYFYWIYEDVVTRKTLADVFKENSRPLTDTKILIGFFDQILQGLSAAHEQQVVHTNLAPESLLALNYNGKYAKENVLKFEHFGMVPLIGRIESAGHYERIAWLSPEVLQNENHRVNERSNIYSAGLLLYQLCSGKSPFDNTATSRELKQTILSQGFRIPSDIETLIPERVRDIILKAVHKNPAERFAGCPEFKKALAEVIAPPAQTPLVSKPRQKSKPIVIPPPTQPDKPKTETREAVQDTQTSDTQSSRTAPKKFRSGIFVGAVIAILLAAFVFFVINHYLNNFTNGLPAPMVDAEETTGYVGQAFQFYDRTPELVGSRLWEFGDQATSTEFNPQHVYENSGTYKAFLTVMDENENESRSEPLTVQVLSALMARFRASPEAGSAPLRVNFTNLSNGDIQEIRWDFGDGQTSSRNNPEHTYQNPGTYQVTLTIRDRLGSQRKDARIVVEGKQSVAQNSNLFHKIQTLGSALGIPQSVINQCRDIDNYPAEEKQALANLLNNYHPQGQSNTGARYQAFNQWEKFAKLQFPQSPAAPFAREVAKSFGF